MRRFVEKYSQSVRSLIARLDTGNGHVQWIERGIRARRIRVGAHIYAYFFFWPPRLINLRQKLRKAFALFPHQWCHPDYPAAVGTIVIGPPVRTIDGRYRFQNSAFLT